MTLAGKPEANPDPATARIMRGVGGHYWLADESGPIGIASARGLFRKIGLVPTVGDQVAYQPSGDPDVPWRLTRILPRRNCLVRPPVANLDGLVITLSAADPAPDYFLVDKLMTVCLNNQIEPLLCLTKTDLAAEWQDVLACYAIVDCPKIEIEPDGQEGLERLRAWLRGKVVSFAGQSGVGKSTLLNRLAGDELMATGGLSVKIGRGRHTTRHVELFRHADGYIADTPGFSSFELEELGIDGSRLVAGYPEIVAVAGRCRFAGCRHLGDLGCAVPASGIDPGRLERYRFFRSQLDLVNPYANKAHRRQTDANAPAKDVSDEQPRAVNRR
jgi:ribosome biogenesis GTPase / thiamine phosphate phosphatase